METADNAGCKTKGDPRVPGIGAAKLTRFFGHAARAAQRILLKCLLKDFPSVLHPLTPEAYGTVVLMWLTF